MAGEIKVELNGDSVNAAIAQAIIDSSLGRHIDAAIVKITKEMTQGWPSLIENVVKQAVGGAVNAELAKPEYADTIRAKVKEALTEDLILKVVDQVLSRALLR